MTERRTPAALRYDRLADAIELLQSWPATIGLTLRVDTPDGPGRKDLTTAAMEIVCDALHLDLPAPALARVGIYKGVGVSVAVQK